MTLPDPDRRLCGVACPIFLVFISHVPLCRTSALKDCYPKSSVWVLSHSALHVPRRCKVPDSGASGRCDQPHRNRRSSERRTGADSRGQPITTASNVQHIYIEFSVGSDVLNEDLQESYDRHIRLRAR